MINSAEVKCCSCWVIEIAIRIKQEACVLLDQERLAMFWIWDYEVIKWRHISDTNATSKNVITHFIYNVSVIYHSGLWLASISACFILREVNRTEVTEGLSLVCCANKCVLQGWTSCCYKYIMGRMPTSLGGNNIPLLLTSLAWQFMTWRNGQGRIKLIWPPVGSRK